jgi:hypothetical protein
MLNILYRAEEGEREKRESGSLCRDYIVLSIMYDMNTIASLYRRERGALTPNLTNVGQAPHIH